MNSLISTVFPFFVCRKANKKLKKQILEFETDKKTRKHYSVIKRRQRKNYFDILDKKYKESFDKKNKLEDKAKTNVIGLTIAITLITGASGIIKTIDSKFPIGFVQWISFFILLVSVVYLIIAGILAVKALCSENTMFFISEDTLLRKDLNGLLEYDECIEKNEKYNTIRNNLIYSSYACIKNSLICMVAILILCTIPLNTFVERKSDNVSYKSGYEFVYSSEIVCNEKNIDFLDVEDLIIEDISVRENITDEICFLSRDDKLVIKYSIEGKKISVLSINRIT